MKSSSTGSSSRAYVIGLLGATVVTLAILEVLLRLYIVPIPNTTPNRVHKVYTAKGNDVVIGDSRVYYAYPAEYMGFVDLSRDATTIAMTEILVREYFRHRRPGRVILQASPHRIREYDPRGYDKYFGLNVGLPVVPYVFELGVTHSIGKLFDMQALAAFRKEREEVRHLGAEWAQKSEAERLRLTRNRVVGQRPLRSESVDRNPRAYVRTIHFLQDRGARVCLVRMPISKEYQTLIEGDEAFDEAVAFFETSARNNRIPYVDFRALPMDYDADVFVNQDHMTAQAGRRFFSLVEQACFGERDRAE